MNHETFFENFELLADAPNSVEELRELILQLAVKGKLVPQDPNEEPTSVLFEKIIVEKERLIKENKLKKSQKLPKIETEEIPFEIPKTWKWARLNDVGDWGAGSTPDRKKPDYYEGSILWFKSGELNNGYINDSDEKITDSALKNCSLRLNKPGDVLIAMYGATIGKVAILEIEATTNQAVCACTCFSGIYNCYLFYLLKAYRRNFSNQGAGGAQPNISRQKIIHTMIPIPPYEEQKRIVVKMNQLMALCDELEARQQKKHEQRIRLNNAALDKLLTAPTSEEFAQHWQRICDNFDLLYDAPETVGQLRQAILQLAVQGKLVAQDSGDESAAVLLEEIKAEKKQMVNEKKIKKKTQYIELEDLPFKIPSSWVISNLQSITSLITDGEHNTPPRTSMGIPLATAKNIRDGYLDFTTTDFISSDIAKKCWNRCEPNHNDILIVCVGATTGRLCLLKNSPKFAIVRSVALIRPFQNLIYPEYVAMAIKSPIGQSQIWDKVKQSAQPCLYINRIKSIHIPIPPLKEQKRIVAKVDQLMPLCDELEAELVQAQTEGGKLMEAVVHHVLAE